MTLEEMITKYNELQNQNKVIADEMNELKANIIESMNGDDKEKVEVDNVVAQVVRKDTFKYKDEMAMINYLKNNGLERYVVEKVDTSLNKELKKGLSLSESLNPMYEKTTSYSLTVKEK